MKLSANGQIKARYYLLLEENGMDLDFLSIPELEVDDEYLSSLPYVDDIDDFIAGGEVDLKKVCAAAFDYHHDRTEVNQAHRKVDRAERIEERDNDPLYWLAIYIKTHTQFKMWLGNYYKNYGVTEIEKTNTVEKYIANMTEALNNFSDVIEKNEHMSCDGYYGFPSEIEIVYPKVVDLNYDDLAIEEKYAEFCKNHDIDLALVANVRVYDNSGNEYDNISEFLKEEDKITEELYEETAKVRKKYGDKSVEYDRIWHNYEKRLEYMKSDKGDSFTLYRSFIWHRTKLRQMISRYMIAEADGELSEKQLENLEELVFSAEANYREMIMSPNYVVGFAVSDRQEVETVTLGSVDEFDDDEITEEKIEDLLEIKTDKGGKTEQKEEKNEVAEEETKQNVDEILLDNFKQAEKLLVDIEMKKREAAMIAGRKAHVQEMIAKLQEEAAALTDSEEAVNDEISSLQDTYNKTVKK